VFTLHCPRHPAQGSFRGQARAAATMAAAWWALGGLLITSFAFLGVNMFLSGLHSYGEL